MRNPIILTVVAVALYPVVQPFGWLIGGIMMLAVLAAIGTVLKY